MSRRREVVQVAYFPSYPTGSLMRALSPQSALPDLAIRNSSPRSRRWIAAAIVCLFATVGSGTAATAASITWANNAASGGTNWSLGGNWVGGSAPASSLSTDDAVFDSAQSAWLNVNVNGAGKNIKGITFIGPFGSGINGYTLSGTGVLAVGASGITNSTQATQTFSTVTALGANQTWQSDAGGALVLSGGVDLSNGSATQTLTLGGAGNTTVSGRINNGGTATSGIVTVTSTGTTTLSGNNTYAGLTTMNAASGVLNISGNNSNFGGLTLTNGTLNRTGTTAGTGLVTITAGTATLGGVSTASGGVTLTSGVLNINSASALGSGTVTLNATSTINNTSGSAVVNAGNNVINLSNNGTYTFGGSNNLDLGTGLVNAVTTRSFQLNGSGSTLTIGTLNNTATSGNKTFTFDGAGNTISMRGINLGTNQVATQTVTLAGSANISVGGPIVNNNANAQNLTVSATGTTTLSGNNTYTGLTTMSGAGGVLTLSGNNSAASGGVTLSAGTLNINSASALGSGTVTLSAGTTIDNTSGGLVTNAGNNPVVLSSSGTYTFGGSNNLDLGTGLVTAVTARSFQLNGTNSLLSIGTLDSTAASGNKTFTFDGAGNTISMRGINLGTNQVATQTVTLAGSANISVGGPIVNNNANAQNLTVSATGTTTLSGNNTYTGLTTMSGVGGVLNISGNNTGFGGLTLSNGTLNMTGTTTGSGAVTIAAGIANMGGVITGTGGVALNAGSLNVSTATALGSGTLTWASGATLNNTSGSLLTLATPVNLSTNGTYNVGIANNLTLSGTVSAASGRTIALTGTSNTLTIGTFESTATTGNKTFTFDNGTGSGNTVSIGAINLGSQQGATAKVTLAGNANLTVTGAIANGGSFAMDLEVAGTGRTILSGASTYSGATTVQSGAFLGISNNDALGTTAGATTVASGGQLALTGGITTAENITLNGNGLIGNGVLANGGGALRNFSGNNVVSGTVTLGSSSRINSDAGLLTLSGGAITGSGYGLTVGGAGDTTIGVAIGTGAGTFTVDGTGTVTLTAANTYSGATSIASGATLNIQNAAALGTTAGATTVTSGGALQLQGSITTAENITLNGLGVGSSGGALRSISGDNVVSGTVTLGSDARINADAGSLTLSGGTITGSGFGLTLGGGGDMTVSSVIGTGSGTLTKDSTGQLTLTAANTYTGLTTVNSGTLSIGNGGTTGSVAGGIANNAAVEFNRSNAATYDGAISGSGTVTKLGNGTLTLTGTSGYTGDTTVSAGSLFLQGRLGNTAVTVENGATFGGSGVSTGSVTVSSGGIFAPGGVAPGSIEGVLTVGSLALNAGSNTNLDIAGSSVAGTDYDQVVVSGGMTYGGDLNLAFTNGSEFTVGTTLNLFNMGGSIGGDLASVNAAGGAYGGLVFTNDGSGVWWSTETASKQFLKFTQATGNLVVVPEPSTWAMGVMGLAMAGLSEFRRRRAGRKAPTTC